MAGKAVIAGTAFVFILLLLTAGAFATPVGPCGFCGDVSVNGEPAPAGTTIIAYVKGVNSGSFTTVFEGEYGRYYPDMEYFLVSEDGSNGDTVTFYVQTPEMSSPVKAAQTAIWEEGRMCPDPESDINLTITWTPSTPSGGETPPSGGSGSGEQPGQNETIPAETEGLPEPDVILIDLDANMNVSVGMVKAQLGNIKLIGNFYSFRVKSLSDFGVMLTFGEKDIIVNLQENRDVDLTGDYVTDVRISLDEVKDNVAQMTFVRLKKNPLGAGTEGISGFLVANPIMGSVMIMALVVLFGGAYYIYRRRSLK